LWRSMLPTWLAAGCSVSDVTKFVDVRVGEVRHFTQ
jgi:hypothetical protein